MKYYPELIASAKTGDWQPLNLFIKNSSSELGLEALKFVAYAMDPVRNFDAIIASKNINPLIFSALCLYLARKMRGGEVPEKMTEDQLEYYLDALEFGNEIIDAEVEKGTNSGLLASFVAAYSIDSFHEGQKSKAEEFLKQCKDVPLSAFLSLVSSFTEKWGGSHQEMFRIARQYFDKANPPTAALIARAHFERRLYIIAFEDDPQSDSRYDNYYDVNAKEELFYASDLLLNARNCDPAQMRLAHGWLALALGDGDFTRHARFHLRELGGFHDPDVWGVLAASKAFKAYWNFAGIFSKE